MPTLLARTVSIPGHTLLVLPAAVLLLAMGDADEPRRVWPIAIAMAMLAATVMGYSWWKVRSGRWSHVDASRREERRSLISCARWCRLSLHLAFALFALLLLWRVSPWRSTATLALGGLLAWSWLASARHAPRDLVAGAIAGACAGLLFRRLAALAGLPSPGGG